MERIQQFIFLIYLLICIYTDLRYRKVYNSVTFPATFLGFLLNFIVNGKAGLMNSLYGFLFGFFFLLIFFILGGVGAGDVKFLSGAGALGGFKIVSIGTLYGAILGGVYVLLLIVIRKRIKQTIKNLVTLFLLIIVHREKESYLFIKEPLKVPYVVFLALGILLKWIGQKSQFT